MYKSGDNTDFYVSYITVESGDRGAIKFMRRGVRWLGFMIRSPDQAVFVVGHSWPILVIRGNGFGYGSIAINTIFRGMNIHLPAILMFTRGTRFWHTAIWEILKSSAFRSWNHFPRLKRPCGKPILATSWEFRLPRQATNWRYPKWPWKSMVLTCLDFRPRWRSHRKDWLNLW